jgi:hypothetical protein
MNRSIKINKHSLDIIVLLQSKKRVALLESEVFETDDWFSKIQVYFKSLNSGLFRNSGIEKTNYYLKSILKLEVTEELKEKIYLKNMTIPVRC